MSPFFDRLHQAASINAKGVAALCHPDPRGAAVAINSLRQSVRILQELSPDPNAHQRIAAMVCPPLMSSGRAALPSCCSFYVYDEPKLFSPLGNCEAVARTQLPVFSAMVVFNTALAYNRLGMETKDTKYYEAAQKLYQSCANLCLMQGGDNENLILLYIGAVNNMALIQNELVKLDQLRDTITTLRSVINFVSSRDDIWSTSNMETVNEFQLNLMAVDALAPACAA